MSLLDHFKNAKAPLPPIGQPDAAPSPSRANVTQRHVAGRRRPPRPHHRRSRRQSTARSARRPAMKRHRAQGARPRGADPRARPAAAHGRYRASTQPSAGQSSRRPRNASPWPIPTSAVRSGCAWRPKLRTKCWASDHSSRCCGMPTITEVMVNSFDRVYFERNGIIQRADVTFRDDGHVLNIIDKILRPVSRRLDDSSPMVDARLPDGSRINAVIPPLAVHGPSLTIRKFSRELLSADDLVRLGALSRSTLDFLAACVRVRANILISGGTGTGKTTLLNLLSAFIHPARADRHHRGPRRAADQARGLGQPRDAATQHRGQGPGVAARPGQERAAYAARPHHGRRVPRRRGLRHAAGHEHWPRRLADHRPRQLAARCPVAYREHGADGRRPAHHRHPRADRRRHQSRRAPGASCRMARAA